MVGELIKAYSDILLVSVCFLPGDMLAAGVEYSQLPSPILSSSIGLLGLRAQKSLHRRLLGSCGFMPRYVCVWGGGLSVLPETPKGKMDIGVMAGCAAKWLSCSLLVYLSSCEDAPALS